MNRRIFVPLAPITNPMMTEIRDTEPRLSQLSTAVWKVKRSTLLEGGMGVKGKK